MSHDSHMTLKENKGTKVLIKSILVWEIFIGITTNKIKKTKKSKGIK